MVAERVFQKERKRERRREIYKKGGWGRSKSDHNPDLRKGEYGWPDIRIFTG